jgi:uncharacterized protein
MGFSEGGVRAYRRAPQQASDHPGSLAFWNQSATLTCNMGSIGWLVWDQWNVDHIGRHEVSPEEVKQVCRGSCHISETYAGRLRIIGLTDAGRMLTVILAPKGEDAFYPVTARSASRKERALYRQQEEGGEAA